MLIIIQEKLLRLSLKELLLIAAVATLATPALIYARESLVITAISVMLLLCMAMTVNAFVASGGTRAFAIGFLCCSALYGGITTLLDGQPWNSRLFTTRATYSLHTSLAEGRNYWMDSYDRRISPEQVQELQRVGGGPPGAGPYYVEELKYSHFRDIAHCLWALLFGYLGGKYAVWVSSRATKDRHTVP